MNTRTRKSERERPDSPSGPPGFDEKLSTNSIRRPAGCCWVSKPSDWMTYATASSWLDMSASLLGS
ncbi:hypothetical protein BDN71DRAFT_1449839 [Pleurotus eryngii]|uniref:Uncharacterized protein n=1 Tax=Pleurotus eryngii TaxID=5323 RepID=A0A9P5ZU85_PLEER|nr:hypothetical protein BDN71DRAFT_1449839 [Pleurotus eryngii]